MNAAHGLAEEYTAQLAIHLDGSSESVLLSAYGLGRKAISDGLSLLELINVHHDALRAILSDESPQEVGAQVEKAAAFLVETLSPFEMMLRGYRESISKQRVSLEIFADALAHDLKEPVRTIRSYLELLAGNTAPSEQGKAYLTRIQNAADRMNRLIDAVDLYTMLDGSSDEIGKETCDVVEVLEEAEENIDKLVRERNAVIVHGFLPRVNASRMQLLQVFQNLLCDAIHHCDRDPVIRVEAAEEADHWLFRVIDNGPGVDEAHRERIFEPFKRLIGRTEGLGLGLAICKKVIESHGGRIWCEPGVQADAIFSFMLPKGTPEGVSANHHSPSIAPREHTVSTGENALASVLLVDDNEADIELTRILLLEKAGLRCNFLAAHDADEAMKILRAEEQEIPTVDLVLLDINMPSMDGLEMLGRMRIDDTLRHVPVVMCTTSISDEDMERAKSLGALGYLTKPVEMPKLKPILEALSSLRLCEKGNGYVLSRASGRISTHEIEAPHERISTGGGAEGNIMPGVFGPKGLRVVKKEITKVLLVEDNPGDAFLLREMLDEPSSRKIELAHVARIDEAARYLASDTVDVILLDLGLPDAHGLEAVRHTHAIAPRIPLIVLTGLDDELLANQALKEGAQDYLVKGQIVGRAVRQAIRYAIERKTIEETLFAEQERARVTLNSIGDAVISTDVSGNVTFLNVVAESMTGWSQQEASGRPLTGILRIIDGTTRDAVAIPMDRDVEKVETVGRSPSGILVRRNGLELPIEYLAAPISDGMARIVGTVIAFHDVSKARAMELEMSHLAQYDFLTELPNRALLNDRLTQAIALATRRRNRLGVLFVDVDRFKHINDSLGHAIGDKLLQSIAARLTDCVRNSDTVSRRGGDEFVILLAEIADAGNAALVAAKVLSTLAKPHHVGQHDLHISASIGISTCPDDGLDGETLIKNADIAMYQAKEHGRNNYQFFKTSMNTRAVERQSLESGLRLALERQEFVLHYQPKLNLETGAITGVEALIRWIHPERGLVPPAQFVSIAEETGLILPIGQWVLHEACRQAKAWMGTELAPVCMAVNISAVQFRSKGFFEGVRAVLADLSFDPKYLELELTETVLMEEATSTVSVLRALKDMGVQIAIDDFGTGYSSLSYLTRFPIDTLKIDRSFVNEITTNPDAATIVSAVIGMGKNLDLNVIAEGIETQSQLAFLRSHHCAEGQGYYFSRPVTGAAFADLLQSGVHEQALN